MEEHWLQWGPPVYMSVASYLGLMKTPKGGSVSGASSSDNLEALERLEREFGGAGGTIG